MCSIPADVPIFAVELSSYNPDTFVPTKKLLRNIKNIQ